jgi:Flp pilus assembly protein TadG
MSSKSKDERGSYAVMFAILTVVLLGFAAIAVDIGNAVARKSDVQGEADFGALAAGHELTAMSGTVPAAVLQSVADSMNENQPLGGQCSGCVTPAALATCGATDTDGCVHFVTVGGKPGLQVIAPRERVDYGLARVLGFSGVDVSANATIRIGSPLGQVPFYAVSGCDEGPQTIADPAAGQGDPVGVPPLAFDSDDNKTDLGGIIPGNALPLNPATQPVISVYGTDLDDTIKVGFFRTDDTSPGAVVEATGVPNPANGTDSIMVTVPAAVTSYQHVWYVRVYSGANASPNNTQNEWSPRDDAVPLRVGTAFLNCGSISSEGNFGTLTLNRDDVNSQDDQIAKNLATKLQDPLSLDTHRGADPSTGVCVDGLNGAIASPGSERNPYTNCVDTKTGLPANAATQGLVTGVDGVPGRLDGADTATGCDPWRDSAERRINFNPGGNYFINDDVLSCFMLDASRPISDLTNWSEANGAALDGSIYDSPRLIFVPVLFREPTSGVSATYSIKGFRPAFITGQQGPETRTSGGGAAENGVIVAGQSVSQINVFFFDISALPSPPPGTELTDYMGEGPKGIQMID